MAKRCVIILCQIIDNYGDAGFCLRLAKLLNQQAIEVTILSDHPEVLHELMEEDERASLPVLNAWQVNKLALKDNVSVIHPFGTSEYSPSIEAAEASLRASYPSSPWLVIDYLTAERWIDDFHLSRSRHPKSGAESLFMYPGFSKASGGLLLDSTDSEHFTNHERKSVAAEHTTFKQIFCFCYQQAPVNNLANALLEGQTLHIPTRTAQQTKADRGFPSESNKIKRIDFVPQRQFDKNLNEYDFAFVRGEDSFLRAQLLGLPLVWQIYPTSDNAHWTKLDAFFTLYANNLTHEAREPLWQMWRLWNGLIETESQLTCIWRELCLHKEELSEHAKNWSNTLKQGKNLVDEIIAQLAN